MHQLRILHLRLTAAYPVRRSLFASETVFPDV